MSSDTLEFGGPWHREDGRRPDHRLGAPTGQDRGISSGGQASRNLAAPAGAWSARHRRKGIFGWLTFNKTVTGTCIEGRRLRSPALAVVALSGALICGCSGISSALPEKTAQVERSVKTNATLLRVAIPAGELVLATGPDGKVSLRGTVTYKGSRAPVAQWLPGDGAISLVSNCPPVDTDCGYHYTLIVPKAINVVVTNTAGDVSISGLVGSAWVNADAGNVSLARLTGGLSVWDGAGDVSGREVRSRAVNVTEGAGNVLLTFNAPPSRVNVRVSMGNIAVALPDAARYRVNTSDHLGTVTNNVPDSPDSGRLISLGVGTGNISLTMLDRCEARDCPLTAAGNDKATYAPARLSRAGNFI